MGQRWHRDIVIPWRSLSAVQVNALAKGGMYRTVERIGGVLEHVELSGSRVRSEAAAEWLRRRERFGPEGPELPKELADRFERIGRAEAAADRDAIIRVLRNQGRPDVEDRVRRIRDTFEAVWGEEGAGYDLNGGTRT